MVLQYELYREKLPKISKLYKNYFLRYDNLKIANSTFLHIPFGEENGICRNFDGL
jgi:hypothetical protein